MNNDPLANNPHPLEAAFGIESGSTPRLSVETNERAASIVDPTTGQLIERKTEQVTETELNKEERIEDLHIDSQLETIHDSALNAFEQQHRLATEVEPKFSARNAEVAAQYLKIALESVNSRVDTKYKRNKIKLAKDQNVNGGKTVNNNTVIVADRNALLQSLFQPEKTVQGEIVEDK